MVAYLESVDTLARVHLAPCRSEAVCSELLDLWQDVSLKTDTETSIVLVNVGLELSVAELVARLKLAIVLCLLLDGIIRKMNHAVRQVG